jgi:hypothetical protein
MKKTIRWFSLLFIVEIVSVITPLFNKISYIDTGRNFVLAFLVLFFLILIGFIVSLLCTFIKNKLSGKILNAFSGENKTFLFFTYAVSGILLLGSTAILILKDLLIQETLTLLIPFSILGYVIFWEILLLLSITRTDIKDQRKYWLGLPILLAINYFYWSELVDVGRYLEPYLSKVYAQEAEIIFTKYRWWELLLPLEELRGFWQYVIILTHYMENMIGISGVWHLNQLLLILVSFFLSWKVFRSEIFSYFLSACLVLGTHFYHAFQYSSITGFYLLHALFLLLMYFGYEYIRREKGGVGYLAATIPVLVFSAILMEGWLDFFASVWVILIFLFFFFRKRGMHKLSRRVIPLFILYNFLAIVYVYIKFTYIEFPHTTGESAVVFAYGLDHFWRIIDDLVSNYITHLYMTLTNFLPPGLTTSNAYYEYYGELMEKKSYVYNHYLFFWRYMAGALTVSFFYFFIKVIKKTFQDKDYSKYLPLAIFMIMVAVNSPTHTIVQIRVFKTMPFLGYQVQQGILGLCLLIAYLMHLVKLQVKNNKAIILISLGVFLLILYCGIHKPNYLWHMVRATGLERQGPYPLPINSVLNIIKSIF